MWLFCFLSAFHKGGKQEQENMKKRAERQIFIVATLGVFTGSVFQIRSMDIR